MVTAIGYTLLLMIVLVDNTYAYLDFGTGSYVLQILAASAIGFVFVIKNYYVRIKQFFFRKEPSDESDGKDPEGLKK